MTGQEIAVARRARSWNRNQLASASGVPADRIRMIEDGVACDHEEEYRAACAAALGLAAVIEGAEKAVAAQAAVLGAPEGFRLSPNADTPDLPPNDDVAPEPDVAPNAQQDEPKPRKPRK